MKEAYDALTAKHSTIGLQFDALHGTLKSNHAKLKQGAFLRPMPQSRLCLQLPTCARGAACPLRVPLALGYTCPSRRACGEAC